MMKTGTFLTKRINRISFKDRTAQNESFFFLHKNRVQKTNLKHQSYILISERNNSVVNIG